MGIVKKVMIDDFVGRKNIYSKMIKGGLDFNIEVHHLENGKHLQVYLLRNHPDIKKFLELNEQHHYLTQQSQEIILDTKQLKLYIDNNSYMILSTDKTKIVINEYNFNRSLIDFAKGKVCILIDFYFNEEIDNKTAVNELRAVKTED